MKAMNKMEAQAFISTVGNAALTLQKQGELNTTFVMFCNDSKKTGSLEDVRANVLSTCQILDTTWSKSEKGFDGYQKALKSGSVGAATFNRLSAWLNTNVEKETGKFLSAEEKKQRIEKAKKEKEEKEKKEKALLKEALEKELEKFEITIETAIDFLQTVGFTVKIVKGKRVITEA